MRTAPGTRRYALAALGLGALLLPASAPLGALLLVLGPAAVVAFHRDPDRTPPAEGVVAPADGTVSVIREEEGAAPDGEGEGEGTTRVRVGIYMSPTDVHVNRAPLGGTVEAVEHEPGGHWPAFTKESDRNERLHVAFGDHTVTLIAGAFARRIHPYVDAGDAVERGDRIGHISFGSRADVVLPAGVSIEEVGVEEGETVRAGETRLV